MSFLYPTFLWALMAISIPIIIHLFNFRRYKKVYFTNVRFLKELKEESDSKSKLKELLILISRILAISFLVLAFAQPFIPGQNQKKNQGEKLISIYIDNSFSMENVNKQGSLLENAKNRANEILQAFSVNDKFQLLTNDFEGKHQRLLSKEEFLEQLDEVKISPATHSFQDIVKRQNDLLSQFNNNNKRLYLLSDFQKNSFEIHKTELDTSLQIHLIPLEANEISNVYIDSCWFENPVQQEGLEQKLHVLIINSGQKDIENGSLKLFVNQQQMSLASFNCSSNSKTEVEISYKIKSNGIHFCSLKLEDYPVVFDDEFYFNYESQKNIPCLVINGKASRVGSYWQSLLKNDSLFTFYENNEAAIDYGYFQKTNLIILSELTEYSSGLVTELTKFVQDGGSIFIIPAMNLNPSSYNSFLSALTLPTILALDSSQTKTNQINFEEGLYEGVFDQVNQQMDLPKVYRHYLLTKQIKSNSRVILSLQNGDPLLSYHSIGKGKAYILSSPLDDKAGNFIKHALFVPTVIKIAINSIKPRLLYYQTALNEAIELPNMIQAKDQPLHLQKTDKSFDVIPEHRIVNSTLTLFTQNQIQQAGHYQILEDQALLGGVSFNYSRKESDMHFYNTEELDHLINEQAINNIQVISVGEKSLTKSIEEINDGKKLWKLCLILTLIFLACEILIIRWFKQ